MRLKALKEAIKEAERFLEAAESVETYDADGQGYICYGKESGALRRRSMDLTRALAELRKP